MCPWSRSGAGHGDKRHGMHVLVSKTAILGPPLSNTMSVNSCPNIRDSRLSQCVFFEGTLFFQGVYFFERALFVLVLAGVSKETADLWGVVGTSPCPLRFSSENGVSRTPSVRFCLTFRGHSDMFETLLMVFKGTPPTESLQMQPQGPQSVRRALVLRWIGQLVVATCLRKPRKVAIAQAQGRKQLIQPKWGNGGGTGLCKKCGPCPALKSPKEKQIQAEKMRGWAHLGMLFGLAGPPVFFGGVQSLLPS